MNPAKLAQTLQEALALHQRGDFAKAESLYRAILKKAPQHFDALHLLGLLADQRGDRTTAISLVRQALKIQSAWPEAHYNLGRMLYAAGDMAGAQQHLNQAIALKPALFQAHNDLGSLYRRHGAYDEAVACFERAARYEPRYLDAYVNLCNTYRDSGNETKVLDAADRGLRVDPNCAPLWQLRAEAAFTVGRLAEGWRDYNWRFAATGKRPPGADAYTLPMWQGESLAGKTILLWGEQGIGDQFIYATMIAGIAAAAQRCVLHTTSRLAPLFARAFPNVEVFPGTVPADILRTVDFQAAMGSVGEWRRPTFNAFPAATDYLKADPAKIAALRAKYQSGGETLLVGISWRSATNFNGDIVGEAAEKSIGLNQWGAILSIPGVTFVNLQYGDVKAEIAAARGAFKTTIIEDATVDNLLDLDTFAAQVAAMDLVISSSNSAAHVAGALGVPTWCMVPRALSKGRRWYWFGAGVYAPWYRAATLFRQTRADWMDVLADVALSLVTAAAHRGVLADPGRYLESLIQGYRSAGLQQEADKTLTQAAAFTASTRLLIEAAHIHMKQGALPAALAAISQVTAQPEAPAEAHDLHGRILAKMNRFEDAVDAYRKSLARAATAETYNNVGTALRRMGRSAEALSSYDSAIKLKPDHAAILLNYATVLVENNRLEEALAAYDRLLALQPDNADAHYNRATTLLNMGRLPAGWNEFKWRLKRATVHVRHEDFPQPVWAGQELANKHVLVWTDLGIGEEVLAASLVPDAAKAARRVTLLCSARLVGLFRRSFPDVIVDVRAAPLPPAARAPDIDLQMSLAELGAALRPTFESFPARPKFLSADEDLRNRLRAKYLAGRENTKLVGISWRSVHPEMGRQKSVPLAQWLSILKTPGITFVNLQYGDCQAELDALQRDYGITVINDTDINPFGDIDPVAAQIAAMDRIVSVSNTTVHLAGGLGVPTSVMLPPGLGRLWYWFRTLQHSPWYPALTLRTAHGDNGWEALIEQIRGDLQSWQDPRPDDVSTQGLVAQARALHSNGNNAGALAAVTQVPSNQRTPDIWILYGDIHLALRDAPAAVQAYREAIRGAPDNAGHHHDLARALLADARPADAETALHTAAQLNPRAWDIMSDLGTAQMEQGEAAAALQSFAAAIALNPAAPAPHYNQASLLRDLGSLNEAEAAFKTAVRLAPSFVQPMIALITLLGDTGRLNAALEWHAAAARIAPHDPLVDQARTMALLRHGRLREGFAAYETRFRPSHLTQPPRPFTVPRWKGEPLAGKNVLIWTEQGIGDEILSASMFGEVIAAADTCAIECTARVAPLLQRSFKNATVVARRDPPDPATQGAFDYQMPSLGLGEFLRQDFAHFPSRGGYLHADPDRTQALRRKYQAQKPGAMVVGISWDSAARLGANKRLPLPLWQPILGLDGITFVSLQYGANPHTPGGERVVFDADVDAVQDMDAAAAQVAAMDLVITVSNTTAHLAGALGMPVWTLLPDGPGCLWYWFRERRDSPWYPSMRLFRQPRPGAWEPVIADVARALVELQAKGRL